MTEVLAVDRWATNAHLIADVAALGYLQRDWRTLDPTYGRGTWWNIWRPDDLVGYDLDPAKSPAGVGVDFRHLPHQDGAFAAVVFDPPYKLNGTPTDSVDAAYGVHEVASRAERLQLIIDGVTECARVLAAGGTLLVKCQDQVNGGKVRWQTDMVTEHARTLGLEKVDVFHMLGGRQQPAGRRQVHARRNHSSLLVFRKAAR